MKTEEGARVPTYAAGTPSWVDLGSPDLEASKKFYGELFGWTAHVSPEPEAGGYTMFMLGDKAVAGAGPLMNPDQPPAWSTYVSTDNADATAEKVKQAGGQVLVAPMDVMDMGRFAVFMDPGGAAISIWQPKSYQGAELVNAPGAFCWNELATRDIEGAKRFYQAVFGWGAKSQSGGPSGSYTEWQLGGKSIAGAIEMGSNFPVQVPPNWLTYFAVDDVDATARKAQQLGGKAVMPAMDSPAGRFGVLQDPHGAAFAVIKLVPMAA
jgi:predicted enzyme related to lactoylglutathione lyase